MKKILFLLILCMCTLCGCAEKKPVPKILPTDVLSLEAVQEVIGDDYTLIMQDNAVKENENVLSVKYLSEPLGAGDAVFLSIEAEDETHDAKSIKQNFEASREARADSILIKGLGEDAYITYPSLHLYTHDLYIKITAGSESSDSQAEILVELGKLAVKNIKEFYERYSV